MSYIYIFISRIVNKSPNEKPEEMIEIAQNRAGYSSGLFGNPNPQASEGLFQPSRFKRLTINLNLFQELNASDQESSKQNSGAKLCEFSFTACSMLVG